MELAHQEAAKALKLVSACIHVHIVPQFLCVTATCPFNVQDQDKENTKAREDFEQLATGEPP